MVRPRGWVAADRPAGVGRGYHASVAALPVGGELPRKRRRGGGLAPRERIRAGAGVGLDDEPGVTEDRRGPAAWKLASSALLASACPLCAPLGEPDGVHRDVIVNNVAATLKRPHPLVNRNLGDASASPLTSGSQGERFPVAAAALERFQSPLVSMAGSAV